MNYFTSEERVAAKVARRADRPMDLGKVAKYEGSVSVFAENPCGAVLRHMFTNNCVINSILTDAEFKVKSGYNVHVDISSTDDSRRYSYKSSGIKSRVDDKLSIKAEDRLTVSVTPIDNEESIDRIWISVNWSNY